METTATQITVTAEAAAKWGAGQRKILAVYAKLCQKSHNHASAMSLRGMVEAMERTETELAGNRAQLARLWDATQLVATGRAPLAAHVADLEGHLEREARKILANPPALVKHWI